MRFLYETRIVVTLQTIESILRFTLLLLFMLMGTQDAFYRLCRFLLKSTMKRIKLGGTDLIFSGDALYAL